MKKQLLFTKSCSFGLSLLLIAVMIPATFSFAQTNDNDKPVITIEMHDKTKSKDLLSYQVDLEGNISGPEDFSIDGDDVYLLNSVENSILKFTNGNISNQIDIDEMKAVKIASEDGNLYVLGNDLTIIQIDPDNNKLVIPVNGIGAEAITDFTVKNGILYIVTSEGEVGTTYIINTKGENTERNIKKLNGRIFDENIVYQVELVAEDGYSIGHSCEMKITDIKSGYTESIIIKSDYWVVGAQFLGYDDDGNYRIKVFEMVMDEDYNSIVEETIQIIGRNGSTKALRGLDEQVKSISNQVKVFGNDIYELNSLQSRVQIIRLSEPNEKTTSLYKSKLEDIVEPTIDLDIGIEKNDIQLMIARSMIMSNAKSFHSNFSWSCKSKNLATLTNWTKPRYIGSSGSYQNMPYCWGGFSSISQYNTGMSETGRVGNINISTSGHVPNTYGLDCSGYVSRCWGTSIKYGTSTIMNVAKKINASELMQGDALNYSGPHIVLFEKYDGYGAYVLYEATTMNSYDRVSHTTRSISSMSNYVPIRYNGTS